jgi:hypothetical protein
VDGGGGDYYRYYYWKRKGSGIYYSHRLAADGTFQCGLQQRKEGMRDCE